MNTKPPPYRSVSSWLKGLFREPVRKITIDAGLGCPNRDGTFGTTGCIYCNPRGSGTGLMGRGVSISEQVDRSVDYLSRRFSVRKFIAYFQSFTNTYADVEVLERIYSEALRRPEVVGLAVGTRPDCVPDPVLNLLERLAKDRLVWVEYGLQSIHKSTLDLINRGHGPQEFIDAVERTRARGLNTVAHLILGLPGESQDHMVATAKAVAACGVDGIKLHPLYVIRGTSLERMYISGSYSPMTEDAAAKATLAVLRALPPHMVIHRLTSDPHREELVAPLWMLDKSGVRGRLLKAMEQQSCVRSRKA